MKNKWLNDIHDCMTDFDIEEPSGLWEDIASELSKQDAARSEKSNPRLFLWAKRAIGIAAIFILAIVTVIWIANYDVLVEQQCNMVAEINSQMNMRDKDSNTDNHNSISQKNRIKPASVNKKHTNAKENTVLSQTIGMTLADRHTSEQEKKISGTFPDSITRKTTNDTISGNKNSESQIRTDHRYDNYQSQYVAYGSKHKSGEGRLSISAYTSGALNSTFDHTSAGNHIVAAGPDKAAWEDNPMLGLLLFNQGKEIETEVKHRLPIRTGVAFDYRITDRLSIGTGLTYTNLTSDLKFGSENHYISGTQKLHYIGIPLSLRYRALKWKRMELYTSIGTLAEKCVKGETDREYVLDNQNHGSESESTKVHPLQWSANASFGFQFNASSIVGLYAEPGVSYYFDNGSSIKTIYKDKPFNFNLNVGLRFTFGN